MYNENIAVSGGVFIVIYNAQNEAVRNIFVPNVVTKVGRQRLVSHLATSSNTNTWFSHIALGDDDTVSATEDDLSLTSEIYREAFDTVFASGETIFGQSEIVATDLGTGSYTIKEVGLYDAASGGNLICRQVLSSSITISGGEKISVLWGVVVQ